MVYIDKQGESVRRGANPSFVGFSTLSTMTMTREARSVFGERLNVINLLRLFFLDF